MAEEHAEQEPATVEAVLAGRAFYDDLATDEEQAAVRAAWDVRIARRHDERRDMTAELEARGTPYYSYADGRIIEHLPGVGARPYVDPDGAERPSDQ